MSDNPTRRPQQAGFSLLEVLVALSIFALSYGVLMQIFGGAARNANIAAQYRQALAIAESQLEQIRAGESPIENGAAPATNDGYQVSVTASPYDEAPGAMSSNVYIAEQVTVEVTWSNGNRRPRLVSLSTLRLRAGAQ